MSGRNWPGRADSNCRPPCAQGGCAARLCDVPLFLRQGFPEPVPANQNQGPLTITASLDAQIAVLSPAILGTATIGKQTFTPAAFTLSASLPSGKVLEVRQGSEVPIVVGVLRREGANGGVSFTAAKPAAGISMTPVLVPPGKTSFSAES